MCKNRELYKLNTEIFVRRAKEVHGEKYKYEKCIYKNRRLKILISCSLHGEYEQLPMVHLKGVGCKKCADVIRGEKTGYPKEYRIELNSWRSMLRRCYLINENSPIWKYYKGRGITVCDRWRGKKIGFKNFIEDMGKIPVKGYTLDRIDVNGNYEPNNCRWLSPSEQVINSRKKVNVASGIRNITKTKYNTWKVEVERNNKSYYEGSYKTIEEAIIAKDNLLKKIKDEMYNNK